MKELLLRTLTGILLVLFTVLAVYFRSGLGITVLFWVLMNIGLGEWIRLTEKTKGAMRFWPLALWGNLLYMAVVSAAYGWMEWRWILAACLLSLAVLVLHAVFTSGQDGTRRLAMTVAGGLYVSGCSAVLSLLALPFGKVGSQALMGFFLLIWAGDVFAYVIGSLLGRHKLCPSISPSKSWEGAAGGFLMALLCGFLWWKWKMPEIPSGLWMGFSAVVAVSSILGDLVESKLKRNAGMKDSGTLLPGHGGVLDRFDSVLFACPIAFVFELVFFY